MPAKKSPAKKSATKNATTKVPSFEARGYKKCSICPRWFRDLPVHLADHKSKKVDENGKRTDRKPAERAILRFRYNGTSATAKFRNVDQDKRAKMKITA